VADNVIVSNAPLSVNADIPVRTIDKSGEQVQVVVVDYGGSGAEDLTVPDFATETTLQNIDTTLQEGIIVNPVHDDILGVAVSGTRNNQLEISFDTSFNTDIITNTNSGTGGATISNGHALYSTGSGTTSSSKGVSVATVSYRPAHEEYAYFTAAFTTPTSANSNQRIGLYDSNNGFFVGYNGTTFGITKRVATVDTFTNRTSWNGDLLTGAVGSKFTRNGIPEAINLTYSNLFRIRFAWLGSASVVFEVFSPDGSWIVFHTLKFPNSQLNPSINSPNLPITIEVIKTSADATDLILYTACVAAGTTSNYSKITDTLTDYTLANLTRYVITGRSSSGGGTYYNARVTPSGSLSVALRDISSVVGQYTMANSLPVVIASNQTPVGVYFAQLAVGAAPTFASVGITSASVGLSGGTYQKLMFCNTSSSTISLGFDNTAVANRGIVLRAGEKFVLDGPISLTTVNAIATGAGSNLAIQAFT
jgi:hypothetical protein